MIRKIKLVRKFANLVRKNGLYFALKETKHYLRMRKVPVTNLYQEYISRFDVIRDDDVKDIIKHIDSFNSKPLISILMPVYNTKTIYLKQAIDSIINQIYPNWELCIADDCSSNKQTIALLKEYQEKDHRIKVTFRTENGHISAASNTALELCSGIYTVLMDHDDVIPVHSLYMVVAKINELDGNVDLIYTDEDKIDRDGQRYDPYFKSDWNYTLIYAQNFFAHMGVYRTSILKNIGGFRVGYEGSQDYDILLRCLSYTTENKIAHIPSILYHWRNFEGNDTFSTNNHDISDDSAFKALNDYFQNGSLRDLYSLEPMRLFPGTWRLKLKHDEMPKVSLIIPTRDKVEILSVCVEGLLEKTAYSNIEVIIVDNGSEEEETLKYLDKISINEKVKIIREIGEFNFSRLNNKAVAEATGNIIGFINNDIEIIHPDWLTEMLAFLRQPTVGVVGAKLLYENNTIQHAGVTLGIYGVACHPQRHFARNSAGYFGLPQLPHEVSAVTAACLLMHKDIFEDVNGFDEEKFAIGFNDVDLCLKVRKKGYKIIYSPFSELYHKESVSRGNDDTKEKIANHRQECKNMIKKYGKELKHDPYYNVNLSLDDEDYRITMQPRQFVPWRQWVEFVCPFHRGDILIAIQVCFAAVKNGVNVRLHVCEDMMSWVAAFEPSFPVEKIPVKMPTKVEDNLMIMQQAVDFVCSRNDFSRKLALSHKLRDFRAVGLNIVEHFLNELELPIDTPLENIRPYTSSDLIGQYEYLWKKPVILLHPYAGWKLKSIPEHVLKHLINLLHSMGFHVVQVGGANEQRLALCDDWILANYEPSQWRFIFESAIGVVCADSWTSHFAAILDIPHLVLYGPTHDKDVSSRRHFVRKNSEALLASPVVECSPCDRLSCHKFNLPFCSGFDVSEERITKFFEDLAAKQMRK
ncbi:MAG: glycosyltransferase [Neisseriaceae bacterium]|nr:MAG: glycosyltransferase [Neisseriaceae bacterium]